jgi:hypothetical protein
VSFFPGKVVLLSSLSRNSLTTEWCRWLLLR